MPESDVSGMGGIHLLTEGGVMAAKPIERHIKRQIAEQGGWDRILERIASGETVSDIARTLNRPDGLSISRSFVSRLLHQDPERSAKVGVARKEGASAMVDDALHIVQTAPVDRDSVNKAKTVAELKLKVAGFIDREQWGEKQQAVNVNLNVGELHLSALRHRETIAASASLPAIEGGTAQVCGTDTLSLPQATVEATVLPSSDSKADNQ